MPHGADSRTTRVTSQSWNTTVSTCCEEDAYIQRHYSCHSAEQYLPCCNQDPADSTNNIKMTIKVHAKTAKKMAYYFFFFYQMRHATRLDLDSHASATLSAECSWDSPLLSFVKWAGADDMRHHLAPTAWTQVRTGQFPCLFASIALAVTRVKLVQEEPLASWQVQNWVVGSSIKWKLTAWVGSIVGIGADL